MIRVSGSTEIEVKEEGSRRGRHACHQGCGGGGHRARRRRALLRAKAAVQKLTTDNPDVQAGINIVLKALEAPIRQIAENSGVEGSIVVGKITDNKSATFGFNAQTEEFVDMLQAGIVDPAKDRGGPRMHLRGRPRHHRGHGRRGAEEGSRAGHAGRRHGRHGLLKSRDVPQPKGRLAQPV